MNGRMHTKKKEELALLQVSQNKQKPDTMVRRAVKAGLADGWSDLMRSEEINPPWMVAKLKDSHNQARQEDVRRKSVVEKVMQRSTNSLRRIIVPVHCHCFPLEDCIWWVSLGHGFAPRAARSSATGVRCMRRRGTRTEPWSYKTVRLRHAPPQRPRFSLVHSTRWPTCTRLRGQLGGHDLRGSVVTKQTQHH